MPLKGSLRKVLAVGLLGAALCLAFASDASAALWGKKKQAAAPAAQGTETPAGAQPPAPPPLPPDALQARVTELEAENARLQDQYKQVEADRDNVLSQTKVLLGEKSKYQGMQDSLDAQTKELGDAKAKADSLAAEKQNLEQQIAGTMASFDELKKTHQDVQTKNETLATENEQLSLALFQRLENDPQVKRMMDELKAEREKSRVLADEKKKLESDQKKSADQLKRAGEREAKLTKEMADVKGKLEFTEAERNNLLGAVREMEGRLGQAPERFKSMAQENQMLIKETSEMHYNMGVYFTEKKQYDQAINEYERALEFNPENAKVHYNLGYLYSEGFKNHEQAVYHFKEYLKIEPQSPLSEQLRSYILARETQKFDLSGSSWEEKSVEPFKKKGDKKPPT